MAITIYSDLTDEELADEIAAFRQARRDVLMGDGGGVGTVRRITDGDRTLEYTSANLGALENELKQLLIERSKRDGTYVPGRAILVEFD